MVFSARCWSLNPGLPISDDELYANLKKKDVYVVPGNFFFPGPEGEWIHRHECIQISYADRPDIVDRGLQIIAQEVRHAYQEFKTVKPTPAQLTEPVLCQQDQNRQKSKAETSSRSACPVLMSIFMLEHKRRIYRSDIREIERSCRGGVSKYLTDHRCGS